MNAKKMTPNIWGPDAWHLIHTISINSNITHNNHKNYINLINSLKKILPCVECREHFKIYTNYYPPNLIDFKEKNAINWSYNIHNMINNETGKKNCKYNDAINKHKKFKHKNANNFVNIIFKTMDNNCSFENFLAYKSFIKSLLILYPCKKCQKKNKIILEKIDNISNMDDLYNLYYDNYKQC